MIGIEKKICLIVVNIIENSPPSPINSTIRVTEWKLFQANKMGNKYLFLP